MKYTLCECARAVFSLQSRSVSISMRNPTSWLRERASWNITFPNAIIEPLWFTFQMAMVYVSAFIDKCDQFAATYNQIKRCSTIICPFAIHQNYLFPLVLSVGPFDGFIMPTLFNAIIIFCCPFLFVSHAFYYSKALLLSWTIFFHCCCYRRCRRRCCGCLFKY